MNGTINEVKQTVSEDELKRVTAMYRVLDKTGRQIIMAGSAMLLASQNAVSQKEEPLAGVKA